MTVSIQHASERFANILAEGSLDKWVQRLKPRIGQLPPPLPGGSHISPSILAQRWQVLNQPETVRAALLDDHSSSSTEPYLRNIENFIGTVKLPVGIAGPLRINGLYAQGDYYVPLATSEAALVASYNRGAALISEVGGAAAALLNEGVSRAPAFTFTSFEELGRFLGWVLSHQDDIRRVAESTTRFGKLIDLQVSIEGNHLYLILSYSTGDASGQNMATIATDAAMRWVLDETPVKPHSAFVEANFSGDKKASAQSLQGVRGKKVTAEVTLSSEQVVRSLHTSVERMVEYGRIATLGGILSGTLGIQGHFANGLAGLFIACGQDAACVAEAAIGTTRMEATPEGNLYVAVTLPNLIVGSVGGGTSLPSQKACLEILGLAGPGHAQALAEVAASLCLAGEISIVGAICAGEFTRAHATLARGKRP